MGSRRRSPQARQCCGLAAWLLLVGARQVAAQEGETTPPVVQRRVDAVYPAAARDARRQGRVVLLVTVGVDGTVGEVAVAETAGEPLDRAAIEAVRQWTFEPARRDERPVASRIRVPFVFALETPPAPTASPAPTISPAPTASPPPAASSPAPTPASPEGEEKQNARPSPASPVEITVYGRKAAPPRAVSDFVLDREVLASAPHQAAADLLSSAPGVYISRPEGDAVAHQIYLRGFAAEHGQDIELTMGPVPINQPSHIHGQGYADLNFIIPEVVRQLRVTEGVYDPRQGDFAVAGSIDFDLGVARRGYELRSSFGSFGTFRQLLLYAPEGEREETFGAVAIRSSDGFGRNRGALSGSAIAQYGFHLAGGWQGLAHVAAHGARASLAGVLRRDDWQAGRVGFYDSYPDPSASAQSASSSRAQAALSLEHLTSEGARTGLASWLLLADFRGRTNFTGYTERSQLRPEWVGRGDLIEQQNHDLALGARGFHRTRRLQPRESIFGTFELGLSFRYDSIDQAQNLLQAPQNETWDRRVDATVRALGVGTYADADWHLGRRLQLRGGFRADVLSYDIDDRLGNFIPRFQRETHLVGYRRSAIGVAYGPRATAELALSPALTLVGSYGQGYRSPQARQLEEGENAPFAKVHSFEGGLRLTSSARQLTLTAAGYATFLSSDLAFDPQEGRLERIGPTSRKGGVAHLRLRPLPWALASLSVTYVHATLDAPPPATAQDPAPAYRPGELLPYVPPLVVRADVGGMVQLGAVRSAPLEGRFGIGFTLLSGRPLPYGRSGDAVALLDLALAAKWRWLEVGVELFNLLDLQYAATEYSFVSDWRSAEIPSQVPARHFSAGAPRSLLATFAVEL